MSSKKLSVVIALNLFSLQCAQEKPKTSDESQVESQELDFNRRSVIADGQYTVRGKDGISGETCYQTGKTLQEATSRTIDQCNFAGTDVLGSGATPRGLPIINRNGTRVNGEIPKEYRCRIEEIKGNFDGSDKTFLSTAAKSIKEARIAAEEVCKSVAGIKCQVRDCFMADDDKWEYQND